MKVFFSNEFKKELNIPTEIYLSAWEEKTDALSESSIIALCASGVSKSLENIEHTESRCLWDTSTKTLQINIDNIKVTIPSGDYLTATAGYIKALFFYYGYEEIVKLAFVLVPESDDELCLTGNNIINLQFLESTRAEFVNYRKDVINDFDFLEGVWSGVKNILVIDESDEVLVSKDSYYRLLRKQSAEEGCKEGRCIDVDGGYQNSYYTFKTYKPGTLKPVLFDSSGSAIMTKYRLRAEGGYVQVRGTVEYEEFKVGKDGVIERIGSGITEISGVDGVTIVEEEKSPTFVCIVDNTWNRVIYAMQTSFDTAPWGIFHLELSFLDENKNVKTITSNSFKLVQGSFESYVKIIDPTTPYTELNNYLFLFEADGTTVHKFTLEIATEEVIDKNNINISAGTKEELDYMCSKFTIEYSDPIFEGDKIKFEVSLSTNQINESESIPIPCMVNNEFKLIPLNIGLVDTDITYKPGVFYLVQKPKTQKLKVYSGVGPEIDTIVLENNQTMGFIALGTDVQSEGDYWKLTSPVDGVIITPEIGEINCYYDESTGQGNFLTANQIAVEVNDVPQNLKDSVYGVLQFTRYLTNPLITDNSDWRMNLSVSTAYVKVIKKGKPPYLTVPAEPLELEKVKAIPVSVSSNMSFYCRFVPGNESRFWLGSNSSAYSANQLVHLLTNNPEYNMKVYVTGQTDEVTNVGKNLYYIFNTSGDSIEVPLVFETMFFDAMCFNDNTEFGSVEFSYTPDFLKIEGKVVINIVKNDSLGYEIGFSSDVDDEINNGHLRYSGYLTSIDKKVLFNQYFFVPHDSPLYVNFDCNYSLFYSISETSPVNVANSDLVNLANKYNLQSKISISAPSTPDDSALAYFDQLVKIIFPTYEEGVLRGFTFECINPSGYSRYPQLPTRLFLTNLEIHFDPESKYNAYYFFKLPQPLAPKWVGYTNYRTAALLNNNLGLGTNNTYFNEPWNIVKNIGDESGYSATITYSEVKEKMPTVQLGGQLIYSDQNDYYPSNYFAKVVIPLDMVEYPGGEEGNIPTALVYPNSEQFVETLAITEFAVGVKISNNPYVTSPPASAKYVIKQDANAGLHKGVYFSLISSNSYNSDSDLDSTSLGTLYLYFRPDITGSIQKQEPYLVFDGGNAESDSTLAPQPYPNDKGTWSQDTEAAVLDNYPSFVRLLHIEWICDEENEAGYGAFGTKVGHNPAKAIELVEFTRDLLSSSISLQLRYVKDIVYMTDVDDIPFVGGNIKPVINYSSSLVGDTVANNPDEAVNCIAESIGVDLISNKIDNAVKISCTDRSCVISDYLSNPDQVSAVSEDLEWSAPYTISVMKQGSSTPEPGYEFVVKGVQKGHNTGIVVDDNLYVGKEVGNNNHIQITVSSGDESVEVNCKAVTLPNLETISGLEVLCDSNISYTIGDSSLVFSFPKNSSPMVNVMNCTVIYQNEDGITDEVTFVINQGAIVPTITWVDSAANGNLIPFLSDGTCIATHGVFDPLVTTSIDIVSNVSKLKASDPQGTLYLEGNYTGDLYEEGVSANNDVLYHFVIDVQLPFNNTRTKRDGTLIISTEDDSNSITINYSQGYYTVLINNKTANEFTPSSMISIGSSNASSYNMALVAERKEYVYSLNQWTLQTTNVSLPETMNGYWTNPSYLICDSEGTESFGANFDEFFSEYTLEELTTAIYKPTLILTVSGSSSGEVNFCMRDLRITLRDEIFHKNTYNYKYYGNSLEFSFNLYFDYVMD